MFSVVYGVLVRPLPYRAANELVVIRTVRTLEGTQRPVRTYFGLRDLDSLAASTRTLQGLAFHSTKQIVLSHAGVKHMVDSAAVSDSFFEVVGGRLTSGRGLGDATPDRSSIVVSRRLAHNLFGNAEVVGRSLTIDQRSFAIVGVADDTFQLPSEKTDLWILATEPNAAYAGLGRLASGISAGGAAPELDAQVRRLAAENPRVTKGVETTLVPLRDELSGNVRTTLWVLLASVALLLVVACANLTNLLIARNTDRARDFAIRIALGASRRQLSAGLLTDAGLPIVAGSLAGMWMASVAVTTVRTWSAAGLPHTDAVRLDVPALVVAACAAGVVAGVIALLPVLQGPNVVHTIRTGSPGIGAARTGRQIYSALVIGQIAISLTLLVGAALLGRSLVRLLTTDIGVRADRVATAAINLSPDRTVSDARQIALVDAVVERLRSMPGVLEVGAGAALPPNASNVQLTLRRFGDSVDYQATAVPATPGYFSALGMQLLKGRVFTEQDAPGAEEVMIVTADTADRFFPSEDPIGSKMTLPLVRGGVRTNVEATLVGIVANVKHSGLQAGADDAVYRPLWQQGWPVLYIVARTAGDPGNLLPALRREIITIDPDILVRSVTTLEAVLDDEVAQPRFRTALLGCMAVAAVAIAALGLYAVMAHNVSRRTSELGIRVALGATRADVVRLVLREAAWLALIGSTLGAVTAVMTTRMLAGLLFGVTPTDPWSFALALGLVLLVAVLAAYLPARRASRLDPIIALRAE